MAPPSATPAINLAGDLDQDPAGVAGKVAGSARNWLDGVHVRSSWWT
jgi:hypothetical protein